MRSTAGRRCTATPQNRSSRRTIPQHGKRGETPTDPVRLSLQASGSIRCSLPWFDGRRWFLLCSWPAPSSHRAFRGFLRLLPRFLDGSFAGLLRFGAALAFAADVFEFLVGQMLDSDKGIMGGADANELVALHLYCRAVAVLGILNQKYHQERNDGGAGVDHQLPGVRIAEQRACNRPDNDDSGRDHEGRCLAGRMGRLVGYIPEQLAEAAALFLRRTLVAAVFLRLLLVAFRHIDPCPIQPSWRSHHCNNPGRAMFRRAAGVRRGKRGFL